jgi:hypothetical protein
MKTQALLPLTLTAHSLACSMARADTGVGVDTLRANKLEPTAGAA